MKTPVITAASFKKCARQIIEEANKTSSNKVISAETAFWIHLGIFYPYLLKIRLLG